MKLPFRDYHLIQVLFYYENNSYPLDLSVYHYFRLNKALGSKDRTFIANTLYTLIRWKSLLDWFCTAPFSWEKRLSLYQNTSISDLQTKASIPFHISVSFPEWLFAKLTLEYGQELAHQICLVSNSQAPSTIRANLLKTTRENLLSELGVHFNIKKTGQSLLGATFDVRLNYFDLPAYKEGLFEVQDEGSQLLAELVDPKPGDHVLDFCSGSGGKTLAFAYKLQKKGQIYLHDIRKNALQEAKKRLKRAGIQNVQLIASDNPYKKTLLQKMDWVLVDAPCSGSGTLRRNPDLKWRLKEEDISEEVRRQRDIFADAIKFLKPTGKIVYGTCSILQEENECQLDYFIKNYPLKIIGEPLKLLPKLQGHDGFYGVVLQKS